MLSQNLNSPAMPKMKNSSLLLIMVLMAATRFLPLVDCRPLRSGSTIEHQRTNNGSAISSSEIAASSPEDSGSRSSGDGGVAFTLASGPSRKGAGH
ncbi:hypothetical protein SDJN03_04765, partial [Cucurbita argyrosperma subsp. sororia]